MSRKIVKLKPQLVRIGEDTFITSLDRFHFRYSKGDLVARVQLEWIYKHPIPKWLITSVFLHFYLARKRILQVLVSETLFWEAPVPGTPLTVAQKERLREDFELAMPYFAKRFEIC